MAEQKVNLIGLSPTKLEDFFEEMGEKRFRATQVLKWIHQQGASSFDEMTNISKVLRERLAEVAEIREPEVLLDKTSKDGKTITTPTKTVLKKETTTKTKIVKTTITIKTIEVDTVSRTLSLME